MAIIHIVLFKLKPELSEQDGKELLMEIIELKKKVPEVETVQLGVNFNPRSKGFTHGFTMTFKNKDALETYDKSEAHVDAVKNYLSPRLEDLLIFDYEVENFSIPRPL
ncbi:hypothetical protein BGZ80_002752 [Entomortierella chlamydospora]|uniref:Stress-response A/B barrel domain-containing protein n=1 Tax=Entomortierella chlamydospora TaxID=101097 RepID=A0A9P6MPV8_9FUNG|nr:hypothetical protein BGZ79_007787 [Entomortierella chlamydospora]KAG0009087.1 hypothetical protein BGZ80_002752 [Entomortierella chlamydospora]